MSSGEVPDLVGLLRETLVKLEQIEGIPPDDPTLLGLKRRLVLIMAELKILKNGSDAAA